MVNEQLKAGVRLPVVPIERATQWMVDGIRSNQREISFPFPFYALVWMVGSFPPWAKDMIIWVEKIIGPYGVYDKAFEAKKRAALDKGTN